MSKVLFGDVAFERRETFKGDKSECPIVGLEHLVPDQIHLTEWSNDINTTFTKYFHKGDVLFGRRRAYLRKAVIAPFDGICSGDITVIVAKEDMILPELLPHIVQNEAFFNFAVKESDGSLSPRVKWDKLSQYEFELPSLDEQKALAEVLWSMVETKEAYQNLLQKTDAMVQARFRELINGKGYPIRPIGTVVDRKLLRIGKVFSDDDTIQYLDISSIDNQRHCVTGLTEFKVKDAPSRAQYVLKKDDILYSTVRPNLQNIAINPYSDANIIGSTGFCVLRCIGVTTGYMWAIVNSIPFTETMVRKARGANYPAVTDEIVLSFDIPIPPEEVQIIFAKLVEQADKSKATLQQTFDALNRTYKKIIAENIG